MAKYYEVDEILIDEDGDLILIDEDGDAYVYETTGTGLPTPIAYAIAGFLIAPFVGCLALMFVLSDSISRWGDFIVIGGLVLLPVSVVFCAWAYVARKRAQARSRIEGR